MAVDVEGLFSDLVRLEIQLWSAVDAKLRDSHDLPLSWFEPLRVIQETNQCRLSDIVDALGITVGGASKLVDRMQSAGLCDRSPDPADGRSSLIALTPAGVRLLGRARVTFRRELEDLLLGSADEASLEELSATVQRLRDQFSGPVHRSD